MPRTGGAPERAAISVEQRRPTVKWVTREQLLTAESAALEEPFRSVLVVGEPRSGKTSFVMLLARRAAARGWNVFEASAANLMAGQQYFGQLEERVQRLTRELAVEKRVLWYVPDFQQLASSGTHVGQAASILDQVYPAMTSGRIVVVSETTTTSLTTILQRRPALRSGLELVRLRALNDAEVNQLAADFASRVSSASGIAIDSGVLETSMHLARHYLGTTQMPGAALDLLRLTSQRVLAHGRDRLRREDVLATLSQLTGMPQLVLDDRERVDLAALRKFFSSRVIGQDEAVEVVVDRIAMLKAGLTDPGKPIGVFLFAGPTGTGKTELAKTLAEFLSVKRRRVLPSRGDCLGLRRGVDPRTRSGSPPARVREHQRRVGSRGRPCHSGPHPRRPARRRGGKTFGPARRVEQGEDGRDGDSTLPPRLVIAHPRRGTRLAHRPSRARPRRSLRPAGRCADEHLTNSNSRVGRPV